MLSRNRERLRTIIGAVDRREAADGFELIAKFGHDGVVARSASFVVYAVRWPVLSWRHGGRAVASAARRAGCACGRAAGCRLDAGNVCRDGGRN